MHVNTNTVPPLPKKAAFEICCESKHHQFLPYSDKFELQGVTFCFSLLCPFGSSQNWQNKPRWVFFFVVPDSTWESFCFDFSLTFEGTDVETFCHLKFELLKQLAWLASMLAVCPSHGKCRSPCWTFNRVLQVPKWKWWDLSDTFWRKDVITSLPISFNIHLVKFSSQPHTTSPQNVAEEGKSSYFR